MSTIEEQLWDYIDGNLDAKEAKAIEEKISTDAELKRRYEDLLALNLTFGKMELDEPSLSFTRNVMESVALATAPVAMKTKVDKKIIYGITTFFVCSLLALLAYAIYSSNFKWSDLSWSFTLDLNVTKYLTPTVIYSFLFADLVIGLVFLDYLLRKRALK